MKDGSNLDSYSLTTPAKQMSLPGFPKTFTLGECIFLLLARKWYKDIQAINRQGPPPRPLDMLSLACLLLSVEWGRDFTGIARDQMNMNENLAATRGVWLDQLPWQLCLSSLKSKPSKSESVKQLTANFAHHNSSVRCWMLEIGWFTRSWLDPSKAMPLLLKNLADTLMGPFMSAGLAAAIFAKEDEDFYEMAQDFDPPSAAKKQYQERIKIIKEQGLIEIQSPFWMLETECWRLISQATFGQETESLSKMK